jgi:hypothetical protein
MVTSILVTVQDVKAVGPTSGATKPKGTSSTTLQQQANKQTVSATRMASRESGFLKMVYVL